MKIGIVVPHIFMQRSILPHVIFSPGTVALDLVEGLQALGQDITLFSPGPVDTSVKNITADLSYFEAELAGRGDTYLDLLKKHPLTFVSLARQVQSELIAKAYAMANAGDFDIIHIYTNEEDTALPFAQFCTKPVAFTHHDPFQLLVKYKNLFPKYKQLNWISMSYAQRQEMPTDTNWIANIYHGIPESQFRPVKQPTNDYVAYLGRIIQPKGTHLAIAAVQQYNRTHPGKPLTLKIAGKHYAGQSKDSYWTTVVEPLLGDPHIQYLGHITDVKAKQDFVANASALLVTPTFNEPFGMVLIEALACGTPPIAVSSGAVPEVIQDGRNGFVVEKSPDETITIGQLAKALERIPAISREQCRQDFLARFTTKRMCQEHTAAYEQLLK